MLVTLLAIVTLANPAAGNDDRQQLEMDFQAACAQGADLVIPAGLYEVSRKQSLASTAIASLRFRCDQPITVLCEPGAAFELSGSALVPGDPSPRAWTLMELGGRTSVDGCAFSGDGKTGPTDEQTHLIQPKGPHDGAIRNVVGVMTPRGYRAGDIIRAIGEVNTPVSLVLDNIWIPVAHRSGIGIQRNVVRLRANNIRVDTSTDQALDYEATGVGVGTDHHWTNCQFSRGPTAGGGITVTLGGHAGVSGIRMTDVLVRDGGVYAVRADDVWLERLTVLQNRNYPALVVSQASAGFTISNSILRRGGTGPVISAYWAAGGAPQDIFLVGSTLIHTGVGMGVSLESVSGFSWRGGVLVAAGGVVCGMQVNSASAAVTSIDVRGVTVTCPTGSRFYQGDQYGYPLETPTIDLLDYGFWTPR